jgi:hypothetical protein
MRLIHEKNQRPKISCYCTFKNSIKSCWRLVLQRYSGNCKMRLAVNCNSCTVSLPIANTLLTTDPLSYCSTEPLDHCQPIFSSPTDRLPYCTTIPKYHMTDPYFTKPTGPLPYKNTSLLIFCPMPHCLTASLWNQCPALACLPTVFIVPLFSPLN